MKYYSANKTGHLLNGLSVRQWSKRPRFNPQGESYQRLKNMVFDASLLNTQHYKVRIEGKVEQSTERSSDLFFTAV